MNNDLNLLITLTNGDFLLKVAIKLPGDKLTEDELKYPLEPENKVRIKKWIPDHIKTFGSIVEVEEILDIKDYLIK